MLGHHRRECGEGGESFCGGGGNDTDCVSAEKEEGEHTESRRDG